MINEIMNFDCFLNELGIDFLRMKASEDIVMYGVEMYNEKLQKNVPKKIFYNIKTKKVLTNY